MEGEVDAGVAPSVLLPGRFSDTAGMARKRDFRWTNPGLYHFSHHQQKHLSLMGSAITDPDNSDVWSPKLWDWDSLKFTAKPSEVSPGAGVMKDGDATGQLLSRGVEEDSGTLTLKIGIEASAVEELVFKPNKRVRSGSPGSSASYPMCQVDACRTDLSNAKDYHRRHKVCELHSKVANALVGPQMQRFCQQCSKFHPLMEFDEGKRSCRRRLAGHNQRRRKTQPEDASANILESAIHDEKVTRNMDIVNLLAVLTRFQGNVVGNSSNMASLPQRDRCLQISDKFANLPPAKATSKTQVKRDFDLNVSVAPQQSSCKQPPEESENLSSPSTMNLLAILSAALSSNPNTLTTLLHVSSDDSGNSKSNRACQDTVVNVNSHSKLARICSPVGGREFDFNVCSQVNSSEHPVQTATPSLPLQLFRSDEDDSHSKLFSASKYPSSQSSNIMEDTSPSCSLRIAKRLFTLQSASETKDESMVICREELVTAEAKTSSGRPSSLDPFKGPGRHSDNQKVQNLTYCRSYSFSSGSVHSPSNSRFDAPDRTGRIIFKLFDKDPSNLPGELRTEILNWLSHSPSEIESYIRPGCVVLSIYLCMSLMAWHELEEDFLRQVDSLVNCSESGFWKNTRFLVRLSGRLASHRDGKIRIIKSWRTFSGPELTSISPIAVMGGQETTLILKGRNLSVPGTIIHCTSERGYLSKDVGPTYPGTINDDDSSSECFVLPEGPPYSYGRYFIEVERSFKGNSFPIIIADSAICKELRSLEFVFNENVGTIGTGFQNQCLENGRTQSREDVLHFLNELERDFTALVEKLLDIVVERGAERDSIFHEPLELLELQLLNRAVKRKCRKMSDMLLNYSVKNKISKDSRVYLFPPNSPGPGGFTPMHLAASMQNAEAMVDALTNDPQKIGLKCWASVLDDNGQTPAMCAASRNNHSYNMLVTRKLTDKENGRVSIMIGHEAISCMDESRRVTEPPAKHGNGCVPATMAVNSCAQCAFAKSRPIRIALGRGLLRWPHTHSVLAIAAVCVCVCLFLRGTPWVGSVAPFKWENLDFGPR
ncbi:squamosa promoter-binding-like protein 15 isoform X2 [Phalaenopsis equestris]|uniref:squamosa promoter-binding-like protein 15 isoform X2 n=1 Tax=Phalaenopsis equestris TaxID=78828 RepID=UPI0009E4ECCB|nr:squamosa promoter-binding-like protein 15 isoform X2 [Phalaenopsis equestris]